MAGRKWRRLLVKCGNDVNFQSIHFELTCLLPLLLRGVSREPGGKAKAPCMAQKTVWITSEKAHKTTYWIDGQLATLWAALSTNSPAGSREECSFSLSDNKPRSSSSVYCCFPDAFETTELFKNEKREMQTLSRRNITDFFPTFLSISVSRSVFVVKMHWRVLFKMMDLTNKSRYCYLWGPVWTDWIYFRDWRRWKKMCAVRSEGRKQHERRKAEEAEDAERRRSAQTR